MRSKALKLLVVSCALSLAACADRALAPTASLDVISRASQVPERNSELEAAGRGVGHLTDSALFRTGARGDATFIVGMKLPGTRRGNWRGERFVTAAQLLRFTDILARVSRDIRVVATDTLITAAIVRVPTAALLAQVRSQPFVDYVEPANTDSTFRAANSNGDCNGWPLPEQPFNQDAYGEYINNKFDIEHIRQAWAISQGFGVSLGLADMVIDSATSEVFPSGADPMSGFASGLSSARTFAQQAGSGGAVCTHAARMAMLMAGPRNQRGTNGVAYGASMRSGARITSPQTEVNINMYTVLEGIRYAADEANLSAKHVVAMAFGQLSWSNMLSDEITRLYYQKDVVFIGAAGTDVPGFLGGASVVIFPAAMNEVLAASATTVTGQRDPASSGNAKVELTAITPNNIGPAPTGGLSQLNHSSAATAVISGVAALVRARFPFYNNEQVRYQLTRRTLQMCETRQDWKPVVDALAAVGSFCGTHLIGSLPLVTFQCKYSPAQVVTVYTDMLLGQNPFTFAWSSGSTQQSATYVVSPPQGSEGLWYNTTNVALSVTDTMSGETRSENDFILAKVLGGPKCRF